MNKVLPLLVILTLLVVESQAQRWKRYRHEAWGGIGATSMLTELGGGAEEAQDLFLDFNGKATRYMIAGGYRYKLNEFISLRGGLAGMQLHGSDAFSRDYHRQSRNITVSTQVVELTGVAEVYFIQEKMNNRYRVRGIRGALSSTLSAYVFAGVGGFYFNPTAKYNGKSYALRKLGTEGQTTNLYGTDPYSRFSFCVPVGLGAKFNLSRNLSLTFEYNFRLTSTDYLDDTSNFYPDATAVANANGGVGTETGDAAAYFSNPAIEINEFLAGGNDPEFQQRGDKNTNDTYMFALIGLNYKFVSKKSNRPKF